MKYLIIAISCILILSLALGVSYREAFNYGAEVVGGFSRAVDTIKYVFSPESFKATLYNTQNGGSYKNEDGEVIDPYIEVTLVLIGESMQIEQFYGKVWNVDVPTLLPSQYTEGDFIRLSVNKGGKIHDVFYAPNGFTYYGQRYEVIEVIGGIQFFYFTATDFKERNTDTGNGGNTRIGFISPKEQTTTIREWFIANYER